MWNFLFMLLKGRIMFITPPFVFFLSGGWKLEMLVGVRVTTFSINWSRCPVSSFYKGFIKLSSSFPPIWWIGVLAVSWFVFFYFLILLAAFRWFLVREKENANYIWHHLQTRSPPGSLNSLIPWLLKFDSLLLFLFLSDLSSSFTFINSSSYDIPYKFL